MTQVTVQINGKSYRMACDDGQEDHLMGLAQTFDESILRLKDMFGEIGDQRLTVMAGIMVMDKMTELQTRVAEMEGELSNLRAERDSARDRYDQSERLVAEAISQAAGQIETIAKKLHGASAPAE